MNPNMSHLGLLVLRLGVGGLMLFHGIHKLQHGLQPIKKMLSQNNLPELLAYGVPAGEVLAPLLIILGYKTRIGGALQAFTMLMSLYIAYGAGTFEINKYGGLAAELNLLFLAGSLALCLTGAGKYSISKGKGKWD
ncbi:MAG: DoxX family protein [Cytophagales bacterium]|nr:DoxX family protein [Cytophagales bacterium]